MSDCGGAKLVETGIKRVHSVCHLMSNKTAKRIKEKVNGNKCGYACVDEREKIKYTKKRNETRSRELNGKTLKKLLTVHSSRKNANRNL